MKTPLAIPSLLFLLFTCLLLILCPDIGPAADMRLPSQSSGPVRVQKTPIHQAQPVVKSKPNPSPSTPAQKQPQLVQPSRSKIPVTPSAADSKPKIRPMDSVPGGGNLKLVNDRGIGSPSKNIQTPERARQQQLDALFKKRKTSSGQANTLSIKRNSAAGTGATPINLQKTDRAVKGDRSDMALLFGGAKTAGQPGLDKPSGADPSKTAPGYGDLFPDMPKGSGPSGEANEFSTHQPIIGHSSAGKGLSDFPDVGATPKTPPGTPLPYPGEADGFDRLGINVEAKEVVLGNSQSKNNAGDESGTPNNIIIPSGTTPGTSDESLLSEGKKQGNSGQGEKGSGNGSSPDAPNETLGVDEGSSGTGLDYPYDDDKSEEEQSDNSTQDTPDTTEEEQSDSTGMALGDSASSGNGGGASASSRYQANKEAEAAEKERVWQEMQEGEGPKTVKGFNPVVDPVASSANQTNSQGGTDTDTGLSGGGEGEGQSMAVKSPGSGLLPPEAKDEKSTSPQIILPKGMHVVDPKE